MASVVRLEKITRFVGNLQSFTFQVSGSSFSFVLSVTSTGLPSGRADRIAFNQAGWILHDPACAQRWWLIPVQDLLSFVFWIAGFFGNTIVWRGKKYYLQADGRFVLVG